MMSQLGVYKCRQFPHYLPPIPHTVPVDYLDPSLKFPHHRQPTVKNKLPHIAVTLDLHHIQPQ